MGRRRADLPPPEPRPCARCRKPFRPTERRRLLCRLCFGKASMDGAMPEYQRPSYAQRI